MKGDLTTLDRVQAWLAPDQGQLLSQPNAIQQRLITSLSRLAMNAMGRDTLAKTLRAETYRGGRTGVLVLRNWPVLSVQGVTIAPATTPLESSLYTVEAIRPAGGSQRIMLTRGRTFFAPGPEGIAVSYTSGFVQTERLTASDDATPTVTMSSVWLQDEGVTQGGTPVAGYTVSGGIYSFPSGLAGQEVDVSYSFVPEDIEQVVIQELGLLFRSRQHIGEASRAGPQGGGSTSYLPLKLSDLSVLALGQYKRVIPQ